ncbi:uncharacterized protein LOC142179923 [Nicotiana tabacum]|uniref:Uncharacterized protein LOC142179923 n=1 Tax=Nicotiana tabacum TaxID=4097 RepID=A0AC58UBQ4_TOBAC
MSFKDIPEARKYINLFALENKKELKKSCRKRLRYRCVFNCPFVIHITGDGDLPGVRVKTLKAKHTCDEAFDNSRIDYYTIASYFKNKMQDNPKFKVKEMRVELKNTFNVNVSYGKCKRAKRLILEKLDGSFTYDYNRLEAYANDLRVSNSCSDIVINLSKDAPVQGKIKFLRKYTRFQELKMGFREGLRPFIGLHGTFLKGKAKGQLSLDLKEDEGITFMSDMQKGLIEAIQNVLPDSHHIFCCRAYFDTVCKNQKVENNFTEFVNAWLVEASNGDSGYEIREGTDNNIVNMIVKKCTCRGCDLTGISCPHAIKSLIAVNVESAVCAEFIKYAVCAEFVESTFVESTV